MEFQVISRVIGVLHRTGRGIVVQVRPHLPLFTLAAGAALLGGGGVSDGRVGHWGEGEGGKFMSYNI